MPGKPSIFLRWIVSVRVRAASFSSFIRECGATSLSLRARNARLSESIEVIRGNSKSADDEVAVLVDDSEKCVDEPSSSDWQYFVESSFPGRMRHAFHWHLPARRIIASSLHGQAPPQRCSHAEPRVPLSIGLRI
ncbi:hypothetical protein C8F01DRAFT_1084321 [Mycena amicta]|nr:hypothetical protein C8F01DRAFT_1084321 [Mycena amicta]